MFRELANGVSPQTIARRLNADGIPGPEGKLWVHGTLRGHPERGTGFLNNELYIGRLVWNRQRYVKDPRTGKRVSRINPASDWIITEVPELRVVDADLWEAVKARQASLSIQYAGPIAATRKAIDMRGTVRPKSLLSALVHCGTCGCPCSLCGQGRLRARRTTTRAPATTATITRVNLEERILAGMKDRLMAPDMVDEAIRSFVDETNGLNHAQPSRTAATARH